MDERFEIIIDVQSKGINATTADIRKAEQALSALNAEGKASDKVFEAVSRQLVAQGRSANSGAAEWKKLNNEIRNSKPPTDNYLANANAIRYANYDMASSLLRVSAAFTAVGVGVAVAFASQESAFTEVERIVGGTTSQLSELRGELQGLSTEIPRSFQDLSGIASLGAALNIPRGDLEQFTKTVATLAAVTGVTEEVVATAFGRLAQYLDVPAEKFDALGAAILKAGNVSIATEEQVIKFTQALAPAADRVGFTTEQTVALGAAIASFGNINVEGAGGALTRVSNIIIRAVGEGGDALDNFAAIAGMSAAEFKNAWQTDADGAFNAILRGLSSVENLTGALDTLGLTNTRDRRIIEGITQNYGEYARILGETTVAMQEGTYMNDAYALVLDDLSTKWTTFINAVMNAASAVGTQFGPTLKTALDIAQDLTIAFTDFVNSDVGGFMTRMATSVLAVVTVWAALRGAIALATGSALAFRTATAFLSGGGLAKGVMGLVTAMGIYTPAATAGATATWNLRAALMAAGKATVIIGVIQLIGSALLDLGGTIEWVGGLLVDWANFLNTVTGDKGIFDSQKGWAEGVQGWGRSFSNATRDANAFTDATERGDDGLQDYIQSLMEGTGVTEGFGNETEKTAAKVRTLTDYASDLASVWSRAFDIRFGGQQTLDTITKSFLDIRQAISDSQQKLRELNADIQGLNSDINIQKYFLGIAEQYGDVKRAEAIRAKLAETEAELAKKTAEVAKEQETQNKTLVGNSAAAINNRNTILGLVQQYQAHIGALASSGLSTDELARQTEQLRQDFITQATQLGFNRGELGLYETAFRDVTVAIQGVPRNITVTANVDPALQALNEFVARAASAGSEAGAGLGSGFGNSLKSEIEASAAGWVNPFAAPLSAAIYGVSSLAALSAGGVTAGFKPFGSVKVANTYDELINRLRGFSGGGFTGTGGMYDAAGIVHRGEYVIPKRDVNQSTGLPKHDALGRLQRGAQGRSSYAGGGYVNPRGGNGGSIDSFGPMAYMQLQQALKQIITLDSGAIAGSVGRSNTVGTAVGSN